MERLLTSLHDLLAPETQPPPGTPPPLSFFKLGLKCSVLHNVASGLDYLHHQTPPIIHRDLSARNILLNSSLVGKLADSGVARIVPRMRDAADMVGCATLNPKSLRPLSAFGGLGLRLCFCKMNSSDLSPTCLYRPSHILQASHFLITCARWRLGFGG